MSTTKHVETLEMDRRDSLRTGIAITFAAILGRPQKAKAQKVGQRTTEIISNPDYELKSQDGEKFNPAEVFKNKRYIMGHL